MDQEQIEKKLIQLEAKVELLETSWERDAFKAEQEITRRWLKKEQLRASRLTIKTEERDRSPHEPEYKLAEFVNDPVKWNSLVKRDIVYKREDVWYVRKTLAEDCGFLVTVVCDQRCTEELDKR